MHLWKTVYRQQTAITGLIDWRLISLHESQQCYDYQQLFSFHTAGYNDIKTEPQANKRKIYIRKLNIQQSNDDT